VKHASSVDPAAEADTVETFAGMFEENHALVAGIAFRILGDRFAAEDVTQSVFLKLWKCRREIVGDNVKGWLSRVARNEAIDVMRRGSRSCQTELSRASLECESPFANVSRFFEPHWTRLVVTSALARLSFEQRQALELGFFAGLTHEEIARALHVPLGTVKSRIRTGLQRMRKLLA
jgi:RNA polymerase sigma-70 factor (ECF subfamily)